jgi:6-phosphogluconolactonase
MTIAYAGGARFPPDLRRFESIEALSAAAADELVRLAEEAVAARGVFHVALSGGSTPKKLFQILAHRGRKAAPWDHMHLWWGDERNVPPDHPDSNYRMTKENLIDPLGLDDKHVHRIRGEATADEAAAEYRKALCAELGEGWPQFDYVMLGMGPDGHTASLFPHSPALDNVSETVTANEVDSPLTKGKSTRITMTAPALNWGRQIRFLIGGGDKADPLWEVLEGARDPKLYPSQLITPMTADSGHLAYYVDHAAARRFPDHAHHHRTQST